MYLATVQTVGTAFTIGGWSIQWYGIIIAAALLAGIGITMAMFKRKGMDPDSVLDLALIVVPLAIIGARVHYVLWSCALLYAVRLPGAGAGAGAGDWPLGQFCQPGGLWRGGDQSQPPVVPHERLYRGHGPVSLCAVFL